MSTATFHNYLCLNAITGIYKVITLPPGKDGGPDLSMLVGYHDYAERHPQTLVAGRSISRASILSFLRVAVAVPIIPEIPRLAWHVATQLPWHWRGIVNSEYLILLALALLIPSRRMIAVLTAELVVVAVEPVAPLYKISFRDAFGVIGNLSLLPPHRLALYGFLLVLYTLICIALLRMTVGRERRPHAALFACAILIIAIVPLLADIAEGRYYSGPLARRSSDLDGLLPYQATIFPVFRLTKELVTEDKVHGIGATTPPAMPSALSHALAELPTTNKPNVVLVLAESWGLADDERMNQIEYAPYLTTAITDHYRVEIGKTPFEGGTIAAEFRELCGESRGLEALAETAPHLQNCWPAKMDREGYSTMAVHGFSSLMFNRNDWYGRLGFQSRMFLEGLGHYRLPHCDGAFDGICDADVAEWIGDKLVAATNPTPTYVHWVTLNTHLPIAPLAGGASRQNCAEVGINGETSLCSWFEKSLTLHRSVAQLANRQGLRPTVFVIVGDHAPPFLNDHFRSRFSSTDVPYVILMPKTS